MKQLKLADVCLKTEVVDPRSKPDWKFKYVDISSVDNVQKKIIGWHDLTGNNAPSRARNLMRHGDIILATTRPNLNAVAQVPEELDGQVCSTGFCVLRAGENLDRDFLFLFVRSSLLVKSLSDLVKGALYPAVSDKQVFAQEIPLPDLPTQRWIAARLKEQLAAVERARQAAEAKIEGWKLVKERLIEAAFQSIPAEPITLGEVAEKIGSGVTPRGGQNAYKEEGIPLIRSQHVHLNRFERKGLAYISDEQDARMQETRVQSGDVLLNITGASIGRVCKVPDEICPANVNQHVCIIRAIPAFDPRYLTFWLSRKSFQMKILSEQSGATRQALTKAMVESFQIPKPELGVQESVANNLTALLAEVGSASRASCDQLTALQKLPAAFLREAFGGLS